MKGLFSCPEYACDNKFITSLITSPFNYVLFIMDYFDNSLLVVTNYAERATFLSWIIMDYFDNSLLVVTNYAERATF